MQSSRHAVVEGHVWVQYAKRRISIVVKPKKWLTWTHQMSRILIGIIDLALFKKRRVGP
jgi:hypothetical protein